MLLKLVVKSVTFYKVSITKIIILPDPAEAETLVKR